MARMTASYNGVHYASHITLHLLWQGEDRDSSDEEWANAYAALDPMAQIGWLNRGVRANGVVAELVRDVFVAADAMHEEAMSEMDGNAEDDEEIRGDGDDGTGAYAGVPVETNMEAECSAAANYAGERGGDVMK